MVLAFLKASTYYVIMRIKHPLIRKLLTILVVIFGLLSIGGSGVVCIGAGGILNKMDDVLEEIEDLERQGLLNNPPPTISPHTKYELGFFNSSSEVKQYIREHEMFADHLVLCLYTFTFLFFLSLALRIYFRKKLG